MSAALKSAIASSQVEPPEWESPHWLEAVSQNPGLAPFFDNLESFVELPEGVEKLREMILDLAVRGNLSEQDNDDEPAHVLLERIAVERKRLEKAKELRKQKYPPTPIGDEVPHALPNGWAWTRLSIVGEIGPRNNVEDDLEVSFLPMKTIADGFTSSIEPEVRPWGEVKKGFTHVGDGDIALAKITPCFQNRKSAVIRGLLNGVGAGTTELHVVRPIGNGIVPEYALLHLKCLTFLNVGVSKMTGSAGQKRVPKDYFADTPFPLPPLAEQRRIVSKVESLMSLCDTLESQRRSRESVRERASRSVLASLTSASTPLPAGTSRATSTAISTGETLQSSWQRLSDHFEVLLDQPSGPAHLRQSILQLAVQGKLVPQDPNDEPASEMLGGLLAKRAELLEAGEIRKRKALTDEQRGEPMFVAPIGWCWNHFENLADLASGVTKGRKLEGRETASFPYLRVANVQRWLVDTSVMKEITIPVDELEKYRLFKGDLLMTEGGDWDKLGRTSIWNGEIENCLHQNHVFRARLFHEGIEREWIMMFMNSLVGREYFASKSKQTTNLASINMTQLRSCPVPVPPKAEQKRIVSKVSVLLSQLDELSARLRCRQSTTDALLTALIHQILAGTDEP